MQSFHRFISLCRRVLVPVLVNVAAAMMLNAGSAQADYPQRPVRIVVPVAPGGANDILARTIAPRLSEVWGQPVLVDRLVKHRVGRYDFSSRSVRVPAAPGIPGG